MPLRSIQIVGGASYVVTLPKEWVKRYGISKGSKVLVEEGVNGELIVLPAGVKRSLKSTILLKGEMQAILREIFASYLEGYDEIEILGEKGKIIGRAERKAIKNSLSRFLGMEVVEEESNRIVLKCFLDTSALDPRELFSRMKGLVSSMFDDLFRAIRMESKELASLIVDRDDEVDRIYFLIVRLVRKASQDSYLMKVLKTNPIELIDLRVAAMLLELIADRIAELADLFRFGKSLPISRHIEKEFLDLERDSIESVLRKDVTLAMRTKDKSQKLVGELSKLTIEDPFESYSLFLLKEIAVRFGDLCDMVSP